MSATGSISELQRVVLTEDLAKHGLKAGDVGTVVHVFAAGGYTVEFCTLAGDTVAVATVGPEQVRPVEQREVTHARRMAG